MTNLKLPRVELKTRIEPGLSEVAVETEDLLQLINGTNVVDGEVQSHLDWQTSGLWPHLLVVSLFEEKIVQSIRYLHCH